MRIKKKIVGKLSGHTPRCWGTMTADGIAEMKEAGRRKRKKRACARRPSRRKQPGTESGRWWWWFEALILKRVEAV